jgi:hypothetical protein
MRAWDPGTWRARRADLVLVPTRREKVELQVLHQFDRGRVWTLDTQAAPRTVETALLWLATHSAAPPPLESRQGNDFDLSLRQVL